MPTHPPLVPIEVDSDTGVWTTDGMPMIYMPKHFFINNHLAVERAIGREAYAEMLYEPGYESAWQWCKREAVTHRLRGTAVFRHYMNRLSQRGWAQFTVEALDERSGNARVRLDHSVFIQGDRGRPGDHACYMFAGWFPGSLEWAGRDAGLNWVLRAREVQCACDGSHDHCVFLVEPS